MGRIHRMHNFDGSTPRARSKTTKRIQKELWEMKNDSPENIFAGPKSEDELDKWEAVIIGPNDTPYQDGIFKLDIHFPPTYPYTAPKLHFTTQIFHPNKRWIYMFGYTYSK